MPKNLFDTYKKFKQESKILTSGSSLRNRLDIMIDEFDRMHKVIIKDPQRFHDIEQKRTLYFKQKGLCAECGKEMFFDASSAHHGIAHKSGGKTDDLDNSQLLHIRCHEKLEKRIKKQPS
jgi:5-methylcytosine-specific restriction endonuclease McrA